MNQFKKINGFEKYIINEYGVIRNTNTGRFLTNQKSKKGYCIIQLCEKGKVKSKSIHRLVYETFIEEIEEGFEINHIDGNKDNNHFTNLEKITHHENILKAVETGLIKSGSESYNSKKILQIDVMTGKEINVFGSIKQAENFTGVKSSSISLCCCGNRFTAGGYKWQYYKE